MRVSIIGPAPPLRGGVSSHTAGLERALRARGHECTVLSYGRIYPRSLFPGRSEFSAGQLPNASAVLDTLRPDRWSEAARTLSCSSPDRVVVQWWHPVTAPALRAALTGAGDVPVSVVCHNDAPHEYIPAAAALTRLTLGRADTILCHSDTVATRVARWVASSTSVVSCPMPILVAGDRQTPTRAEARERLGVAQDAPLAVFIGHVRRYKGLDLLLDAWRDAALPPGATLRVAGEWYVRGQQARRLRDQASRLAGVQVVDRFLSEAEMIDTAAAADVVVLPYRSATQSGLVPIVAALGTPMIVSGAGALAEQLAARGVRSHPTDAGAARASEVVDLDVRGSLADALTRRLKRPLDQTAKRPVDSGAQANARPVRRAERADLAGLERASWEPTVRAVESLKKRVVKIKFPGIEREAEFLRQKGESQSSSRMADPSRMLKSRTVPARSRPKQP